MPPVRFRRPRPARDPLVEAAEAAEALFAAGRYEQARTAFATCIRDHQAQLPAHLDDPAFNGRIGGLLNNLGLTLLRMHRAGEAVEVLQAAVAVFDGLARLDDPDRWRPRAAGSLQTLASALAQNGQRDRALTVSREAVELRRLGPYDLDLARALRMFATVRAAAGAELDEALSAMDEAMAVHLTLLQRTGRAALDELYTTELAMAAVLERLGRSADAARVAAQARSRHLDGLPDPGRRA